MVSTNYAVTKGTINNTVIKPSNDQTEQVKIPSSENNLERSPKTDEVSFYSKNKKTINILGGTLIGDIAGEVISKAFKITSTLKRYSLIAALGVIGGTTAGIMTKETSEK